MALPIPTRRTPGRRSARSTCRVRPAFTFRSTPLRTSCSTRCAASRVTRLSTKALQAYQAAPPAQQKAWTDAYTKGLDSAKFPGGIPQLPAGDYGPVAPMMASLAGLAATGGLDGALVNSNQFYQTNYTKPLLFLSGGGYFETRAEEQHLLGTQWGMMNETGSYPRPGLALALHLLVPDRPVQHVRQRGRSDLGPDDASLTRVHLHPGDPRAAKPPPPSRGPPADLARPLPARRGRQLRARYG